MTFDTCATGINEDSGTERQQFQTNVGCDTFAQVSEQPEIGNLSGTSIFLKSKAKSQSSEERQFIADMTGTISRIRAAGLASNWNALAVALNERGVKSVRGKKWSMPTIKAFVLKHGIDFEPSEGATRQHKEFVAKKNAKTARETMADPDYKPSKTLRDRAAAAMRARLRQRRFADLAPVPREQIDAMIAARIAAGGVTLCKPFTDSDGNVHNTRAAGISYQLHNANSFKRAPAAC